MLPCSTLHHGSHKSIDRASEMEHFFIYFWNEIRLFQVKTCCWSLKNYNYTFINYSKKTDVIVRTQLIPKTLKLFEEISSIGDELKFVIILNFWLFYLFFIISGLPWYFQQCSSSTWRGTELRTSWRISEWDTHRHSIPKALEHMWLRPR